MRPMHSLLGVPGGVIFSTQVSRGSQQRGGRDDCCGSWEETNTSVCTHSIYLLSLYEQHLRSLNRFEITQPETGVSFSGLARAGCSIMRPIYSLLGVPGGILFSTSVVWIFPPTSVSSVVWIGAECWSTCADRVHPPHLFPALLE